MKVLVDTGYRGLAKTHPDQVIPPPLKLRPGAWPEYQRRWEAERKQQSSHRIPVEHAIAELKWWRQLQRYTARRQLLPESINATAGLSPTAPSPGSPTSIAAAHTADPIAHKIVSPARRR